jgi:hypothetical protein
VILRSYARAFVLSFVLLFLVIFSLGRWNLQQGGYPELDSV